MLPPRITMTTMAAHAGRIAAGHQRERRRWRTPPGLWGSADRRGPAALQEVLTLYTTPVIYLYLDRFRLAMGPDFERAIAFAGASPRPESALYPSE